MIFRSATVDSYVLMRKAELREMMARDAAAKAPTSTGGDVGTVRFQSKKSASIAFRLTTSVSGRITEQLVYLIRRVE